MIQFTADKSEPDWKGYFYAVLLFITAIIQSLFLHQYFHRCFTLGMRLRSAIVASVYKKVCVSYSEREKEGEREGKEGRGGESVTGTETGILCTCVFTPCFSFISLSLSSHIFSPSTCIIYFFSFPFYLLFPSAFCPSWYRLLH